MCYNYIGNDDKLLFSDNLFRYEKEEKRLKPVIAITMGDPAGIGAEIAVKMLNKYDWSEKCIPIVIGDRVAMEDAIHFTKADIGLKVIGDVTEAEEGYINLIDMGYLKPDNWEYKKVSKICGEASFNYVQRAAEIAMEGKVQAIVTGPINKEAINLAGYHYSGHTEILATLTNTRSYAMLLLTDLLKVIHVTTHVSMREACDRITKERVYEVICLADEAMKLLGVAQPRIGVAGLNAHSSENGLFGWEEKESISPAIEQTKQKGIIVDGPVPPDTVFVKAQAGQYDIVVAMYHDQGHIPIKLSGFKLDVKTNRYTSMSGVNCTVGLPIIRTSVDHGTAFGKAGEGRANEQSLVDAMDAAITMAKAKFGM